MGVIIKESSRATIISYIGVLLGFISSALIMPKLFSPDQIGVIRVINAASGIFAGIFSLGVSQLVFRTFNRFGLEKGINGFFSLIIIVCILGGLFVLPVFMIFEDRMLDFSETISGVTAAPFFFWFVYAVIVFRIFQTGLEAMLRMTRRITTIAIMQNLLIKGIPLLLLALYFFKVLSFDNYIVFYLLIFILIPFYAFLILRWKDDLRLGRIAKYSRKEVKTMISLSTFGMLNTMAAAFFLFLDTLMVNEYLSESDVGVYTTMFLFGSVVSIPSKSLRQISGVTIVEEMDRENYEKVREINKKSAESLLAICGGILGLIIVNLPTITGYLDPIYTSGLMVVVYIGIAQLFDATMGTASEIISASKYYWLHTPITIAMMGVAIASNILLIPRFGIDGAAMATLFSYVFLHGTRTIMVYVLFKIHPFSVRLFLGVIAFLTMVWLTYLLPNLDNIYFNLIYKSFVFSVAYFPFVYFAKISSDLNQLVDKVIFSRLKRNK